jgi:hypothetical protein
MAIYAPKAATATLLNNDSQSSEQSARHEPESCLTTYLG